MTFKYNVGLQNVGSYQVSGRPWCKHIDTSTGLTGFIEFPNVTKNMWAHFENNSANQFVKLAFCEPRRAVSFTGTSDHYSTTFSSGLDELTISLWFNTGANITSQRIIDFDGINNTGVRTGSTNDLRIIVNGVATIPSPSVILDVDTWYNLSLILKDGESKIYLNGELKATSTTAFANAITGFEIGDSGLAGLDGIYDEIAMFSQALSDSEVEQIWNSGSKLNISHPSLISYWAFEDNHYKTLYAIPDTPTLINDRVSSNNLEINQPIGSTPAFVDGHLIYNALESHNVRLDDHTQITLPFKCRGVFYSFSSTNESFSLFASLTNIPASRMYELTGPGIDE